MALVLNSRLELVGFTVGNDMSSRDIEGENPLYLPQAKIYDACCGLGPWITLRDAMPPAAGIGIRLTVRRQGTVAFEGSTSIAQMARSFDDLIGWLGREMLVSRWSNSANRHGHRAAEATSRSPLATSSRSRSTGSEH